MLTKDNVLAKAYNERCTAVESTFICLAISQLSDSTLDARLALWMRDFATKTLEAMTEYFGKRGM